MDFKRVKSIKAIQDYLRGAEVVAFDFETAPDEDYRDEPRAALDAHKSHIVGISFSVDPSSAIYYAVQHRGGVCEIDKISKLLEKFAKNTKIVKVAHNMAFESMFLYKHGIVLQEPLYDTFVAAHFTKKPGSTTGAFRDMRDSGLKTLIPYYFHEDLPSFEDVTQGRHFDELDPDDPETVRYACADSAYALRLYRGFNKTFDKHNPKYRYLVEKVESPTAVFTGIMKYNGLLVDRELMEKQAKETAQKIENLREMIKTYVGNINIGLNASTKSIKDYIYKDQALPVLKATDKGQAALDDEALIDLMDYCEKHRPELVQLFKLLQEYRKMGKIKSTYIKGYMDHINSVTGRIHPDLLPLKTVTGRFASQKPNLQNMPRAGSDSVGIRNFFIAPSGKLLLSLDFSQIELRVGAFYCRDKKMLEVYRTGGDIHAQTTSVIYGIPYEQAVDKHAENYKERRTIAKNVNFGVFYGLFPTGLQKTLKYKAGLSVSYQDCENIIKNLKAGYPRLAIWQEKTKRDAADRNCLYTETWLGRRRFLVNIISSNWGIKAFNERCALNTPIQGTAADILKISLGIIIKGLPGRPWLKPLLQIHDELVFEIPEDKLEEAVKFVKNCMEQQPFPEFDIPIVAEASAGVTFGKMEEIG